MNHPTNMGDVNSHAKGDCGHNDINAALLPFPLCFCPKPRIQTGMVSCHLDARVAKCSSDTITGDTLSAVYNACLARTRVVLDELHKVCGDSIV